MAASSPTRPISKPPWPAPRTSTELAAYVNLAKVIPAKERAKFPMVSFGITQGAEDGNPTTGLIRLIIG